MNNGFPSDGPGIFIMPVIIGLIILIPTISAIATYNRLVNLRNLISESWSNIDTELRRRYDLIPNLVNTVKAYAAHEQAIFQTVADARSKAMASNGSAGDQSVDENNLVRSLRQLFAVSEGYPNLKVDQNFLHLQKELVNTEDRIQAARRFFNGNVRDYNTLISAFPSNIIAGMGGFRKAQYFEIEEAVARAVASVTLPTANQPQ
jgi:LemA protein